MNRFLAGSNRREYLAFGLVSLGAITLTGIMSLSRSAITRQYLGTIPDEPSGFFRPFFGVVPPLLAIAGIAAVGTASLSFLRSRGWFEILPTKGVRRGLVVSAIAGTLLGLEAILVESSGLISFDEDINVPFPWSLSFYPVIAYVVEVVFHALPLALLLALLGSRFGSRHADRLVWSCILAVSLIEPIFQIALSESFSPTGGYIVLQVFAINIVQLYVYRRYGFVSMLSLRLAYYSWWHVIWGYFRLQMLF